MVMGLILAQRLWLFRLGCVRSSFDNFSSWTIVRRFIRLLIGMKALPIRLMRKTFFVILWFFILVIDLAHRSTTFRVSWWGSTASRLGVLAMGKITSAPASATAATPATSALIATSSTFASGNFTTFILRHTTFFTWILVSLWYHIDIITFITLIFWGWCSDTSAHFANLSFLLQFLLPFLHLLLLLKHLFVHSHFLHFSVFKDRSTVFFLARFVLLWFFLALQRILILLVALLDSLELSRFYLVALANAPRLLIFTVTHIFIRLIWLILAIIVRAHSSFNCLYFQFTFIL